MSFVATELFAACLTLPVNWQAFRIAFSVSFLVPNGETVSALRTEGNSCTRGYDSKEEALVEGGRRQSPSHLVKVRVGRNLGTEDSALGATVAN